MKEAFTLIELLVVIAIIAILAAILFPVFAQAKAAAKKTAVLAQYKQAGTATAIYLGDVDDTAPMNVWNTGASGSYDGRSNTNVTWAKAVEPYTKNWQILNDRSVQDPLGVWNSTPAAYYWWGNWQNWPAVAYNANYLNNARGDCSMWQGGTPAIAGYVQYGPPINMTSIASPSATVEFVSVKRVGNTSGAYMSFDAESPGAVSANDTCSWSNGGWGVGSFGDTPGLYPGNPTSTGDFATPYTNQGIVVFTDTSAKTMPAGRLAAGTNWRVGIADTAVQITDRSQYLWDTQQ